MKKRLPDATDSKKETSTQTERASGIPSKSEAHISHRDSRVSQGGIRRRPSQERASVTVEAILQAAAELFCNLGYDRSSTNRIAERAGVSIGSLYQYFANKEAILAALLEEHQNAVHAVAEKALIELDDPGVHLAVGLENLLNSLVEHHAEDPELTRVLSEEVPHLIHGSPNPNEVDHYALRVMEMLRRRPEVSVSNVEVSATILVATVEALTRWLAHGVPFGDDKAALIREASTMLVVYLTTDAAEGLAGPRDSLPAAGA